MDSIYKYSDYRKFLHDYYLHMKKTKRSFSYRTISARAGINSSGFYPLVVQGKRNLTTATIQKTAEAIDLNPQESHYFELLVLFNQARTLKDKNHFFAKMVEFLNQKKVQVIPEDQYDIFSQWYHSVIRELVVCRNFDGDFGKLGKMLSPPIKAKEAKKSVNLLLKLGFLKEENGSYVQSSPVLTTGPGIKAHQVINYQMKMLSLAQEAFDRFGPDELMSNSSTTLRISKQTYELFRQKNRQYRQELLEIARQDEDADMVYQLNINLFPVTCKESKENNDE